MSEDTGKAEGVENDERDSEGGPGRVAEVRAAWTELTQAQRVRRMVAVGVGVVGVATAAVFGTRWIRGRRG
jgi:hypothetical protein